MDSKIIIYGAEWCAFCHQAMRYLDDLGVKYTYKNVDMNPVDAREAVEKSGQTGIPVIDIDGTIIIGFDRPKIDDALKAKKLV
jgi:glutaredoxin 3